LTGRHGPGRITGMRIVNVVGGQFGSEAKGHVAARIAADHVRNGRVVLGIRVAGPNAGHSAYGWTGKKYALRTVPVMAVVDNSIQLYIGPGSEVDLQVLVNEIDLLENDGIPVWERLTIHPEATVLEPHHIERERGMHERLGSTGKGVGAVRAARIMREAVKIKDYLLEDADHEANVWTGLEELVGDYDNAMRMYAYGRDNVAIVEGTQGYGLGLHAGYYPYCTSSDCRNIDFMAMANLSPWGMGPVETTVVLRTFPIRVAGNSGPLVGETSWERLAMLTEGYIKPEYTTVTKKKRRVGWWDPELARRAIDANGGPDQCSIALTFLDYIDPDVAGVSDWSKLSGAAKGFVKEVELDLACRVSQVTTGPNTGVWL
jgi:adenylosuccinate synthase